MSKTFHSNGKLLLTSEYVVLDGANALAIPTRFGQSLSVDVLHKPSVIWKSLDHEKKVWFSCEFELADFRINKTSDTKIAEQLSKIIVAAQNLNPLFLTDQSGYEVRTTLDFPKEWGLGTSSTLINNIAQWAKVDAFKLLDKSFGGSGYDIAAAQHDKPILYSKVKNAPTARMVTLNWNFKDRLFFVHLNKKQDSKEGIKRYSERKKTINLTEFNALVDKIVNAATLSSFEAHLRLHEDVIASQIGLIPVQKELFPDYNGTIKSLGAWGGDFILATGGEAQKAYFRNKGYYTIISFDEMIK